MLSHALRSASLADESGYSCWVKRQSINQSSETLLEARQYRGAARAQLLKRAASLPTAFRHPDIDFLSVTSCSRCARGAVANREHVVPGLIRRSNG